MSKRICYLKPKHIWQCKLRNCHNCQVWLEMIPTKEGTRNFDKDKCMYTVSRW